MQKNIYRFLVVSVIMTCFLYDKADCQNLYEPIIRTKVSMVFQGKTNEWTSYLDIDSIKISYKVIKCSILNDSNLSVFIVLRFENNTNADYQIEWFNKLFNETTFYPKNNKDREAHRKIDILKHSTIEGSSSFSALRIFLKTINQEDHYKIDRFQLDSLQIKKKY